MTVFSSGWTSTPAIVLLCLMVHSATPMKFFRYRRPSLKTLLGITTAKKRLKKELGITALLKPVRWWPNQKRRMKRQMN